MVDNLFMQATSAVEDGWVPPGRHPDGSGQYNSYRTAILVVLRERARHGYELVSRLSDLGFHPRLVANLYTVLRSMEEAELVASSGGTSTNGGPPRLLYRLTTDGHQRLGDSMHHLIRRGDALGALAETQLALRQAVIRRSVGSPVEEQWGAGAQ